MAILHSEVVFAGLPCIISATTLFSCGLCYGEMAFPGSSFFSEN